MQLCPALLAAGRGVSDYGPRGAFPVAWSDGGVPRRDEFCLNGGTTLHSALSDPASGGVDFVGRPGSVAAEMDEAMDEIGGDGFMITEELTRRSIAEMTDGLAATLKRRGLIRSAYRYELIRDNLLEF